MGLGVFFAIKKLNKQKGKKEDVYLKEFNEGKILIPIDKRDFENFDKFKEDVKDDKIIKKQLDEIDKDFENREFTTGKSENKTIEAQQ